MNEEMDEEVLSIIHPPVVETDGTLDTISPLTLLKNYFFCFAKPRNKPKSETDKTILTLFSGIWDTSAFH